MPRRSDIWRTGIVDAPLQEVLDRGMDAFAVHWLPEQPPFTFSADPFGWWADDRLHLFVEYFDYRTRRGVIDVVTLARDFSILERRRCLEESWHLSYPFVFGAEGGLWMLPEAHRSGGLTLYRCECFPDRWIAEARITLDCVPIDASPVHYRGHWWLFYSPAGSRLERISKLHVAWAEDIRGPWTAHPANPVFTDIRAARPGGTPVVIGDRLMLPVQDCSLSYGGAIRPLWITRLDAEHFTAEAGAPLAPPHAAAPYVDGVHTLSACGPVTLIDAKRIDRSLRGLMIDARRFIRRSVSG